jgi:hypothetical protein
MRSWRNQAWLLKKSLQWQKLPKLGDRKCIPRWRKSFIGHPSASRFLCEDAERVFQQPQAITLKTPASGSKECVPFCKSTVSAVHSIINCNIMFA